LEAHLADGSGREIFQRLLKMLRRRASHPACHPEAAQHVFDLGPELFAHSRISLNRDEVVFCIYNLTPREQSVRNPADTELLKKTRQFYDILGGKTHGSAKKGLKLGPYQAVWLVPRT